MPVPRIASTCSERRALLLGAAKGGPSGVTYAFVMPPSTTKSYEVSVVWF